MDVSAATRNVAPTAPDERACLMDIQCGRAADPYGWMRPIG